ncbi:hypothetical protein J6590_097555 [Homalodisca vitripennis]|nr:hypothetical protein J6590_097555 [Homalodisca vitripennis]
MGANSTEMPSGMFSAFVKALFSSHPVRREERVARPVADVPIMEEEFVVAVPTMRNKKALGPNGFPAERWSASSSKPKQLVTRLCRLCCCADGCLDVKNAYNSAR